MPLKIGGLQNVDYRTKTFSCSKCGAAAYVAIIEPIKETGMEDYRLDEIEAPSGIPLLSIGSPVDTAADESTTQAASYPVARSTHAARPPSSPAAA